MLQNIEQERLYSCGKSLNLTKSLLRTVKDFRFPPTCTLQLLACNSFVDTRWRHKTPVSEMKDCVNHNLASIVNTMFASVFIVTKVYCDLMKGSWWMLWTSSFASWWRNPEFNEPTSFTISSKPIWSISQRALCLYYPIQKVDLTFALERYCIFLVSLIHKHSWKDSPEQMQSVTLLVNMQKY